MTPPTSPGNASWEQLLLKMVDNLQTTVAGMDRKLDEMRAGMVPRPEFEAHKTETDRRLGALENTKSTAHDSIHQKIASTAAELRAEIDKVETEGDAREDARQKWARDVNTRVWIAVGGAALAFAVAGLSSALGIS